MNHYPFDRHTPPRTKLSFRSLGVGIAGLSGVISLLSQFGIIDFVKDIALDTARNTLISLLDEELQKDSHQPDNKIDITSGENKGGDNITQIEGSQSNQGGDQVNKGGAQTATSTGGNQVITGGNQNNNQTGSKVQVHSPFQLEQTSSPATVDSSHVSGSAKFTDLETTVEPRPQKKSVPLVESSPNRDSINNNSEQGNYQYPISENLHLASYTSSNTFIPNDVESMWVFYQDKNIQSPNGCNREYKAQSISPESFMQMKDEFIDEARSTTQALIITAYAPSRNSEPWDSATREIKINGKSLNPMTSYWCNGKLDYGYEYPI